MRSSAEDWSCTDGLASTVEVAGGEKSTTVLAVQPLAEMLTLIFWTFSSRALKVHLKKAPISLAGIVYEVTGGKTESGRSTEYGITETLKVRVAGTDGSKFSPKTLNQSVVVGPVKAGIWPRITLLALHPPSASTTVGFGAIQRLIAITPRTTPRRSRRRPIKPHPPKVFLSSGKAPPAGAYLAPKSTHGARCLRREPHARGVPR